MERQFVVCTWEALRKLRLLLEALNKDAIYPETLANLIVCNLHLGKSSSRYLSQLKLSHPDHVLVKTVSSSEANFERALQAVA
jgi:coatomer protein complex subunit epsilon